MAIIRRFLCWSDTRKGSAFSAFYSLAVSAIGLTWYLVRYISMGRIDDASEFRAITFAAFGVYCLTIICSLIMLPGIFLDQRYMFCPWLLVITLVLLFEVGAIGLLTTAHLQIDTVLSPWEISGVVLYLLRTVMNVCCLICVISQYQELSEGRGSYDYLYKNRRPQLHDSNTDSSLAAFALPPPPYSPEDPMKEFAPPAYSNYVANSPDGIQSPGSVLDRGPAMPGAGPWTHYLDADSVIYCNRTYQSEISNLNTVFDGGAAGETVCDVVVLRGEEAVNNETVK